MREQLPQCQRPRRLRIAQPQIREVSDDRCVQIDPVLIDQLGDVERSERFRDRPDVEKRSGGDRRLGRQVPITVSLLQHDSAIFD
jgi:hypothetical protein